MNQVSAALLLLLPILADAYGKLKPRIILPSLGGRKQHFDFCTVENHTVFYHEQGMDILLVGATEKLYFFNFTASVSEMVEFKAEDYGNCQGQANCKNFLMVLDKFDGKLLVCGTNAYKPRCWHLMERILDSTSEKEKSLCRTQSRVNKIKTQYGSGFSPFVPETNFLILFSGEEVFSTVNKFQNNGKILRFRRIYGKDTHLYTNDHLMQNPQFVKVTIIEQEESYKDKIYYFFREDNQQKGVDHDFTISRVAQLCKGDGGGEGSVVATMWTTFLKARLVCAYESQKRLFNMLHDVFIVKSENWTESRVYGIFSNPWGFTAVCVYSIGDIDRIFRTSNLKGNSKPLPSPRPGECLTGGQSTPTDTFNMVDNYPEVEDEVKPIGNEPLFQSHFHYTKIVVDQLIISEQEKYNVLLLATDKGMIHKVVEQDRGALNILEIPPFKNQAPIQSMTLDSKMKRLYVGSTAEVVQVPLDMCDVYKDSCKDCILDPYCGWDKRNCSSILLKRRLQNIRNDSRKGICETTKGQVEQSKSVEPFSRYFIPCHITSHHANYSWLHNGEKKLDCLHNQPTCYYHINNMTDNHYGTYTCISDEDTVRQTVAQYTLVKARGSMVASHLFPVVLHFAFFYMLCK
ncbi:semaphorin-7A [Microcaecilia unicolor]|uniref:Semaphorin-7A n=1 Tax=Microcaecilia unicolor TaxID=1415580 RepID=A0A6P7WR67_9AMPH|nr:semaphorin-7A [Microcaecilia unicolor]